MQQSQTNSLTRLLELLKDAQWHSSEEIANKVSFRFGHAIYQARKQGNIIEARRELNKQYQYRWVSPSESTIIQSHTLNSLEARIPHLKFLVLFGSRARGDYRPESDWDFGIFYDEQFFETFNDGYVRYETYNILSEIYEIPYQDIDVVELNNCSELLAHYIARDGKLIYEKEVGSFQEFCQDNLMNQEQLEHWNPTMKRKLDNLEENQ